MLREMGITPQWHLRGVSSASDTAAEVTVAVRVTFWGPGLKGVERLEAVVLVGVRPVMVRDFELSELGLRLVVPEYAAWMV